MLVESLKRTLAAAAISFVLVTLPAIAIAQAPNGTTGSGFPNGTTGSGSTFPAGTSGSGAGTINNGTGPANCGSGNCAVQNPLGSTTSLCGLLKKLFQAVVTIAIPIAVLFIIWSGFQFVLAQGRPKELQKARKNFYYTLIGIAIFLGAWLLATIIASTINAIGGSNIISCN
ncbi:MAG TPA: pilin [Candidatus Paceibacterota bacterium]